MNKRIIALSAAVIGAGMLFGTVSNAFAYRGDPNVQGPNYSEDRHEAITQALDNNDFNAWKTQMSGNGRVSDVVNESNFSKYVEMHKLLLEGKTTEAEQIRTELGLGLRDGSGFGQGNGSGYGRNANR